MATGAIPVGGETFHALVTGPADGPVALCLHGFPDVPATWGPVMERLAAAGYRAVAPSLRGYAPSPLAGPFDLEQLTGDVFAIADHLAPERAVHLLGHDWGAVLTALALSERPDRFGRSVTAAVPHPLTFLGQALRSPRQLWRSSYMARYQLPGAASRLAARQFAEVDRLWAAWSPGFTPPDGHLAAVKRALAPNPNGPLAYYRGMVRPLGPALRRIQRARGRRIAVPVLHLHGAKDGCISVRATRGQRRWYADGCLDEEVLDGVGHFLTLEAPDRVADRILAFFGR